MSNSNAVLNIPVDLWLSTIHALSVQGAYSLCVSKVGHERSPMDDLRKALEAQMPRFWRAIDDHYWSRIIIGLRDKGFALQIKKLRIYKVEEKKRDYEPIKLILVNAEGQAKEMGTNYRYLYQRQRNDLDYFYNVDLVVADLVAFYEQFGVVTVIEEESYTW